MDAPAPRFRLEYLLMVLTTFFWAIGHPLGRIILREVHPFQLAAMNLSVGFLCVLVYLAAAGRFGALFRMSRRDFLGSCFLGVFGFFTYQIGTFSALARIPASMNAVLVATNVVLVVLLSALVLRERIPPLRVVGVLVALSGVVLITFNQGFVLDGRIDLTGVGFSLSAAVSFALYTVLGKRILSRNDPLLVSTLALFAGAVLLDVLTAATVGFGSLRGASGLTWGLMLPLGATMIGVAYPLWFFCLKRLPASHISVFIYMTPTFAVVLSLLVLGERFAWLFWMGAVLVLGGIAVANLRRARPEGAGGRDARRELGADTQRSGHAPG
ncbi:MAG: DMT family transporter [Spirochaetales bacterium]|nr:DMT family transporter [Spirochaetales bacterium]